MKILCHQGLGDHIIMNGLVRATVARRGPVELPVRSHYLETVRFMYRDCPAITCVEIPSSQQHYEFQHQWGEGDPTCLRLGLFDPRWHERLTTHQWDEVFYRQADLTIAERWTSFAVTRSPEREEAMRSAWSVAPGSYQIVHDDPTRSMCINPQFIEPDLPIVRILPPSPTSAVPTSANLFDYALLVQEAAVIHCFGSSLFCLVESLPMAPSIPLILHDYLRPTPMSPFRHSWKILQ